MIWQRIMMKPSGKQSEQVRLCNPAGCSAQRSLNRPRNNGCESRPASHSGRPLRSGDGPDGALSACSVQFSKLISQTLLGVIAPSGRHREQSSRCMRTSRQATRTWWTPTFDGTSRRSRTRSSCAVAMSCDLRKSGYVHQYVHSRGHGNSLRPKGSRGCRAEA